MQNTVLFMNAPAGLLEILHGSSGHSNGIITESEFKDFKIYQINKKLFSSWDSSLIMN